MKTTIQLPSLRRALWLTLFVACAVHAQADAVRQAQELVRAGQVQQAFDLLDAREVEFAGDPDFDLNFGIVANEAQQFTRAIIALERVLTTQPAHERARAELGRALYGVGDHQAARKLLGESRDKGITAVAGETIDQLLHSIDRVEAEGRSSAKGYVEWVGGTDSNINGAPGISQVAVPALGGSIVAIDPSGTRKRGQFAGLSIGGSGRMVLGPRWSLIGTASARGQWFNKGNGTLDNSQLDLAGGVSYRVEREEYTLVAQAGTYLIDGDRIRDNQGLVGEWTYRFDGFRQFNAYFQTGRLTYPQSRISDADRHVIGATYAHLTHGGVWAYGGAYAGREVVLDDSQKHLAHHLAGLRGGLQVPVRDSLGIFVAGGWERRHYDGSDPSFQVRRQDRQANLSLGLSWGPAANWRVTPQVAWTRTNSNVPLAEYRKLAFSLAVRRDF